MAVKCGACGADNDGWIPKERLDKVSEQRRNLRDELASAQQALEDLQSETSTASAEVAAKLSHAETLQARVSELENERGGWATERALMAAGVTDEEGVGIARLLWDRMGEDDRPASVGDWLRSDSVPLAIRAYLPPTTTTEAPATTTEAEAPATNGERVNRNPPTNRGATAAAPTAPIYSKEAIANMAENGTYKEHAEQIRADWRNRNR